MHYKCSNTFEIEGNDKEEISFIGIKHFKCYPRPFHTLAPNTNPYGSKYSAFYRIIGIVFIIKIVV